MLKYLNYKLATEKGKKRINQLLSLTLAWRMSVNTLFTTALHPPVASLVEAFFGLKEITTPDFSIPSLKLL